MSDHEQPVVERFRALFSAELPWMWSTLGRLGVRPADREDIAHDVFLHVYRKLEDYDASRPLRPWLFAFAYRAASDYRRRARHRREEVTDEPPEVPTEAATDEMLERREESALVQAALDAVDLDRRAILIAFEIEGTPMKDIADTMGIPLNTAYSRLRIGREELASEIRRRMARRAHPERRRGEA